ncbi:MAG: hypothetical protein PVF31_15020, partial [Desulfobacterales bacterium]
MQPRIHITNTFQFIKCHRCWTRAALVLLIIILGWTSAAHATSYNYRKRITIDHNQVSSSCSHLYDFPVLIV